MFQNSFSGNLINGISDHLPQFLIFTDKKIKSITPNSYYRNWKSFNAESFREELLAQDWDSILLVNKKDVDASFNNFISTVNELVDKHVPLKKLSRKQIKNKRKP